MQKWEYLILGFHSDISKGYYSIDGKILHGDFHFTDKTQNPFLVFKIKILNELGDEGWELLSEDGEIHIFKRPKQ